MSDIENENVVSDIEAEIEVPYETEEEETWGDDSFGADANSDESEPELDGPINPLAAIFESGVYDTDKVPDNPNTIAKGSYECELRSVKIDGPNKFRGKNEGRSFIKLVFSITDPSSGYMFKTVTKKVYLPKSEEMKNPNDYSQELADKMRQAYNRLGIPRSEFKTVDLQEYVKREYQVGIGTMELDDGTVINVVSWWKPINN